MLPHLLLPQPVFWGKLSILPGLQEPVALAKPPEPPLLGYVPSMQMEAEDAWEAAAVGIPQPTWAAQEPQAPL